MKKIELNKPSAYQVKQSAIKFTTSFFRYAFLLAIAYIIVMQLIYVVSYAFRTPEEVYDASVVWLPKKLTTSNLSVAWTVLDYGKTALKTFGILIVSGLIEIITCALPAYGIARFKFRGKGIMLAIVILMILLPPQMTAVSMSLNYAHFDIFGILGALGKILGTELRPNLLDTGFVFWLPSVFGVGIRAGLFIFIYTQFFKGLPKELEEAASIDGANAFTTFTRVIIPSSGVAFLTVAIFSMVWHWNDYNQSVLFFTNNYPISIMLKLLKSGQSVYTVHGFEGSSPAYEMAACLLYMLPLLIMYIILQRKFIASVDRVGIVG